MQELWHYLEVELEKLAPDLLSRIRPGVDEITIAQAEHILGFVLPEEINAFFREQNGSDGPLFGNWVLFSLEDVCREWLALKALHPHADFEGKDDPLEKWNPSWLPLMRADYGFLSVKVSLSPDVQAGCVFIHDQDGGFVRFFDDLDMFFEMLRGDLQAGAYRYDEHTHRLHSTHLNMTLRPMNELELWDPSVAYMEGLTRVVYPGLACLSYERNYADQFHHTLEQTIEQSWEMVLTTIKQLAPGIHQAFVQERTSFPELERIEEAMQVHFPEEIRTWYETYNERTQNKKGFLDWWDWYSVEEMYRNGWQVQQRKSTHPLLPRSFPFPQEYRHLADRRVQFVAWHPQWLPLMYQPDGSLYCADLAPTPGGYIGQIILLIHLGSPYRAHQLDRRQIPQVLWVAPSLRVFLAVLAQDLVEGKYSYDKRDHMLWSSEGVAYVKGDYDLARRFYQRRYPEKQGWKDDPFVFPNHRYMF